MTLDESFIPKAISRYTQYQLPATIYVAYGKYVSTLTTPPNSPKIILLIYDYPITEHTIMIEKPVFTKEKRG